MGYEDRGAVLIVWYDPASGGLCCSGRLDPAVAAHMTEEELCIDLIRRIIGVLEPHWFVARDREAPHATCAVRSSVVEDRRQRHGGVVEDFLIRISVAFG
jgi:hypothetical protein